MADADSTCACLACGKAIERKTKKNGEVSSRKPIYCSAACKTRARRDRMREAGTPIKQHPRFKDAACRLCGAAFRSRPSGKSPGGWTAYCSVKCAQQNRHALSRRLKPVVVTTLHGHCKQCGKHYEMSASTSTFCSISCREARWRADLDVRKCCVCSAVFTPARTGGRFARACSAACRSEANRRQQRIAKSQRRARIRKVSHEAIDPIAVFVRDKWKCQLCGVRTPKRLRGTYEDTAPELDHIVALADGGAHTWCNVQCACRRCNGAKGATSRGQLGLPFAA